MANNDYFTTVQREAVEVGIQPLTNDAAGRAAFNDDTKLSAPYLKLKKFTDKCQRMLIRTLNKTFTKRQFMFNTTAGVAGTLKMFSLDALTNIEGVEYHSVRCNTTGAAQPLANLSYREFRETWTDTSKIPVGKPQQWVAVTTPAAQGVNRLSQFIILPIPNAVYQIEYEAKISTQPLVNDVDVILFPVEYEDVLWTWAEAMLESKLGVDATMADYARMVIDSCRMWTERPIDEKRGIKMGVKLKINGTLSGSYYDNPTFTEGWGV
jgi:hypothetical protein